jgi:four helix bundle protein
MRPARHYSELIVWQLADEIRQEVFKLTKRPRFARDFKAQGQADDAINSVCRNIAEGFACETHGEFATFLVYSVRSLNEIQDAMRGAEEKGYVNTDEVAPILQLFKRLFPALGRFIAYLRRTPNRRRRSDKRDSTRTDKPQTTRTDQRQTNRTDNRQTNRTDTRQTNRTDNRQTNRTDQRQNDRTDER